MLKSNRKYLNETNKAELIAHYQPWEIDALGYATVRDYCDSADHLPWLSSINNDLKNVQRPWMIKAILAKLPVGARILEIGGGEPFVVGVLAELGYQVFLVDPYDGSGHGPTDYERFQQEFSHVHLIRGIFNQNTPHLEAGTFDGIFSISVLEHVHEPYLDELFQGIQYFLRPDGYSIHAVDYVLQGNGSDFHTQQLLRILRYQAQLIGEDSVTIEADFVQLVQQLREDIETYYLSAEGHNLWRGQLTYDEFPFRKCVSIQTVVCNTSTAQRK